MSFSFCGLGNNEITEIEFEDNLADIHEENGLLLVASTKHQSSKTINFFGLTAI